jgi:uncharacterized protein
MKHGEQMQQRFSFVTFGVKNLELERSFYQKLGFVEAKQSNSHVAFFQMGGVVFSLYGVDELAKDACVQSDGSGFRQFALAYNVENKNEVAQVLQEALNCGGKIVKPAQDVFWGGHSGYFADPEGFLWEVAWNPGGKLLANGDFKIDT